MNRVALLTAADYVASVLWRVQTTRTGAGNALVAFEYLNSEIQGISGVSEWSLQLWQASSTAGTWSLVSDQSVNPSKNEILAQVSTAPDRYFALAATGSSTPATIDVYPDGLWSVQDAIDAIDPGGTVVVDPGVYCENIHFSGKDLVLKSTDPDDPAIRAATILDGAARGTVITFQGGETEACIVEGFTITNGASPNGAGIFGYGTGGLTHATIRKNVISGNMATGGGGGGIFACAGPIESNLISGNYAPSLGGGILLCLGSIEKNHICDNVSGGLAGGLSDCFGPIQNNVIYRNQAATDGGGLSYCNAPIVNNTIWANEAGVSGGGLSHCESSYHPAWPLQGFDVSLAQTTIINDIVWENLAPTGPQLHDCEDPFPNHCCIQDWTGGGTGNISTDPNMLFPGYGDFHLETGSPCIGAGTTVAGVTDDWEGDSRPYPALGDFDIGADENQGQTTPSAPSGFSAQPDDTNIGIVRLYWTSVPSVDGYYVYWANRSHGPFYKVADPFTQPQAELTMPAGPRYYWTVTATSSGVQSRQSSVEEGTVLRTVILDPGHGGGDSGATGLYSIYWQCWITEEALARNLVKEVIYGLAEIPNPRILFRTTRGYLSDEPTVPDINQRPEFAKIHGARAFLSIHFNDPPEGEDPNDYYQMEAMVYSTSYDITARTTAPTYPHAPGYDQFNPDEDYLFVDEIERQAHRYNDWAGGDATAIKLFTDRHERTNRDSLLHYGYNYIENGGTFPPSRAWHANIISGYLEVNYIKNQKFHDNWNDGYHTIEIRAQVGKNIGWGILNVLDRLEYWYLY